MRQTLNASIIWLVLALAPVRAAGQTSPWLHFTVGPSGPSLDSASLVYDFTSNSLIVFGGNSSPCCKSLNDTWLLTNANATSGIPIQWQQLSPAGTLPAPRSGHSAVYDRNRNRMIVFAVGQFNGSIYGTLLNDVWVLTHADGNGGTPTWIPITPLTPNGSPAPRAGHRAVYDPKSNQMTIFGGGNNGIMDIPNDVWVLSNANGLGGQSQWTLLLPSGNPPAVRENEIAIYSTANNAMTVFGGCCPSMADVWSLSNADGLGPAAWLPISPTGSAPAPRESNGTYGYDPDINVLLLFGGLGYNPSGTPYNDIWMLTEANNIKGTPAWINTIPNGLAQSPPASDPHGAYDTGSKRLMALIDATDLWVMTTRNGIDVSCTAGVPSASQLAQLQASGI